VRESFARQPFMSLLGARMTAVRPGEVEVEVACRDDLTQQNGFVHAGVVTSIADVACGYAAHTLMPPDSDVLSVEFKLNLMAPAIGDRLVARARVVKAGRTLSVCAADVFAHAGGTERVVATMLATMIRR
jgi:uncharacterized protein (TIGR00369 family)